MAFPLTSFKKTPWGNVYVIRRRSRLSGGQMLCLPSLLSLGESSERGTLVEWPFISGSDEFLLSFTSYGVLEKTLCPLYLSSLICKVG